MKGKASCKDFVDISCLFVVYIWPFLNFEWIYIQLENSICPSLTLRLVTNSLHAKLVIVFMRVVVILFIKKMWHCAFWHCKWAGPLFDGPSNSGRYTICRSGEGKVSAIVLILANTFGLVGTQPVKFVEISSLIGTKQVLWHKNSAKYISSNIPYPKTLTHKVYHKKSKRRFSSVKVCNWWW